MALVSLVRAHCSDPSFTKLIAQGGCMALVSLVRAHYSDPSFIKLLAQGALQVAGVPGDSALF